MTSDDQERGTRWDGLAADGLLVATTLVIGALLLQAGVFTVDESHYLLAAHAFAQGGSFQLDTGYAATGADALLFFYTVVPARVAESGTVATVPPFHAVLAAPFLWAGGLSGLFWLNLVAFATTLVAVRRIAARVEPSGAFAWLACGAFGLATFSLEYALGIWPHALSQALVAWALVAAMVPQEERGPWLAVAAGLLGGVATGVRLQNILLLPVLLVATRLCLRWSWLRVGALVAGWLSPLLVHAWINLQRLGTFNPFSYGNPAAWSDSLRGRLLAWLGSNFWVLPLAALVVAALVWGWKRTRRKLVPAGLAAGLLLLCLLVPSLRAMVLGWLASLGFHLVDTSIAPPLTGSMGAHPNELGQALFGGVMKKGLLEAAPWIVLSLAMLLPGVLRQASRESRFLLVVGWLGVLVLPAIISRGGLCYNPRYLLELLPPLAVAALAAATRLGLTVRAWLPGIPLGILGALPLLLRPGSVDRPAGGWLPMLVPLGLALALLVTGGAALVRGPGPRKRLARSAIVLLAAAVVYAGLVHLRVDLASSLTVRHYARQMLLEGREVVPPAPAASVLLAHESRVNVFSPLKLDRDVWVGRLQPSDESLPGFLPSWLGRRRVILLRNGIPPARWSRWVAPYRVKETEHRGLRFAELSAMVGAPP